MRPPRIGREQLVLAIVVASTTLDGCERCQSRETKRRTTELAEPLQCSELADCVDDSPCSQEKCVDGQCVVSMLPAGTSCDNGTVCDGVAKCDARGDCITGPAPVIDDGNACTIDECDPKSGVVRHQIPIDDADACTVDACDPRTGQITHTTIVIDDGNACTVDSCDRTTGPKHKQPDPYYTCQATCEPAFHAASKTVYPQCGSPEALRAFCVPNCENSFHSCDANCPAGYHSLSRALNRQCGPSPLPRPFCEKTSGDSFYTCDASCPAGYRKRSQKITSTCGSDTSAMIFCAKTS